MAGQKEYLFDALVGASGFDDSARADHQNDLRVKVLQAFDQSHPIAPVAQPTVATKWTSRYAIGMAAVVAACWLGIANLWFADPVGSVDSIVVEHRPDMGASVDAIFLASLTEVDALRDEVPRDVYFDALATCQQEHSARLLELNATQMRWLYHSSFPTPSIDSPKG